MVILGRYLLVSVVGLTLAVTSGITSATAATESSPDLSTVIVSQPPLPGYTAIPLGADNGPVTKSNVSLFGPEADTIEQHIANGDMTAYIRTWTHQPPNGNGLVILAVRFEDPSSVPSFLAGFDSGAKAGRGVPFAVPQIANATAYRTITSVSGASVTEYMVDFGKGNTAFIAEVATASGTLSQTDAITLAAAQSAADPGTPVPTRSAPSSSTSTAYKAGEVFFYVLLGVVVVGLVVVLVQRRGRKRSVVSPITSSGSPLGRDVPPPPSRHLEVGWHPHGQNPNEQAYWDGQAWTGIRRWSAGRGWSDYNHLVS